MTAAHNLTIQVQSDHHQVDVEDAKDVVVNGAPVARTPAVAPAAGESPLQVDLYGATFVVSPNTLLGSHKFRQGGSACYMRYSCGIALLTSKQIVPRFVWTC
jgi:hypothetical protein